MAEQDLDRNDPATPHKLQKARQQGKVAKSADIVSFAVLTAALLYLTWRGWGATQALLRLDQTLLTQFNLVLSSASGAWVLFAAMVREAMAWGAPFLAILVITGVVANIVQTGPVLSVEPLKVDLDRLNPATGFKRLFSTRTLVEAAKAAVKLGLLMGMVWYALLGLLPHFHAMANMPASVYFQTLLHDIAQLGWKMALALCLLAIIDLAYNRHEFAKKMRMSKREAQG